MNNVTNPDIQLALMNVVIESYSQDIMGEQDRNYFFFAPLRLCVRYKPVFSRILTPV